MTCFRRQISVSNALRSRRPRHPCSRTSAARRRRRCTRDRPGDRRSRRAPTQLFIAALSSIRRYCHSPAAGSAGAKNTWTPPGVAFGFCSVTRLLSFATTSSRPSPFRSRTAISWPLADLVEDDAADPLAAFVGVDDDLVAVPRLDGGEEALAVLPADADIARAEARRLLDVARREQLLLEFHRVAAAARAVERDAFEAGDEELLALAAVPHHRPDAMDDAGNLGGDDVPLPVLRAVPEHRGLVLVVGRRQRSSRRGAAR